MTRLLIGLLTFTLLGCASVRIKGNDRFLHFNFRLEAKSVKFMSSANSFEPIFAQEDDGWWNVKIKSVPSMTYYLVVDGREYLPECEMKEKDDFGGEICLFVR